MGAQLCCEIQYVVAVSPEVQELIQLICMDGVVSRSSWASVQDGENWLRSLVLLPLVALNLLFPVFALQCRCSPLEAMGPPHGTP